MRWPDSTFAELDGAIASARRGSPSVIAIQGQAGFGKSTLLREAATRLDGFHVLRAFGEQTGQDEQFQLLGEWGAGIHPRHAMHANRLLADIVDKLQLTGPVALVVDDLQWIDPDSVQALSALIERAVGDRLLVLSAYRPLGNRHPAWRRLDSTRSIHLDGLDAEAAADLVISLSPGAPASLVEPLRVHTSGSPLHMRALLQEHSAPELAALAARGELPAPADLAAAVNARIAELAPDAARLLHTLAVLGDTWSDVATAAAIAEVDDIDTAVDVLADESLLRIERSGTTPRVRIAHAVLRAAAYGTIPAATRRRLHQAAAARLIGGGEQLRHRLAAASGPDDGLASDLDRHADDLHARTLFREAARYRRLAASATSTPAERERRLLDADVEAMLARDGDMVLVDGVDEDASPHRRFVWGMRLSGLKRWVEAAEVLEDIDPHSLDRRNLYRALVVKAWMTLASGRSPADALALLQAAAATPAKDGAFNGLFVVTFGQVQQAMLTPNDPLWGFNDMQDVDRASLVTSLEGLHRLSWRGSVYAITGSTDRAIGDLTVVTDRMDDGTLELSDGILHAFLGFAQWCGGEWRRASITLELSKTFVLGVPHPAVRAIEPLAAIVNGDDPRPSLARSRDARMAGPISAAIFTGDVVEVAAMAFAGSPHERRRWLAKRSADFGVPRPYAQGKPSSVWLLAMGIGTYWARDAAGVDTWADALAARPGEWRPNAVRWLRALSALIRGEKPPLDAIARAGLPGLGSFGALLRVHAALHCPDPRLRSDAESALARLGAGRYTAALLPESSAPVDPLAALSERERNVTTLVLEGLSYAQIAAELHVTRSTVAFHLSKIYPKTNTASRHELVQLLRGSRA